MKLSTDIYNKTARALAALLLTAAATACVQEADQPGSPSDADTYRLLVGVSVPSNASRAPGHTDEPGTEAEEYVNILDGDYSIAIYNSAGQYVSNVEMAVPYTQDGYYWVEGVVSGEQAKNIGDEFTLLVVANWKSFDNSASYGVFSPLVAQESNTTTLWKNDTDYLFTHQTGTGNTSWKPSISDKKLIPMFGIAKGKFSDATRKPGDMKRVSLTVPLLRAIAKVEIIDNINGAAIEGITLTKYNTKGRYIPDLTDVNWNGSNDQIIRPSLPAENMYEEAHNLVFSKEDKYGTTVWTAYIPEMDMTSTPSLDNGTERPHMEVTVNAGGQSIVYPLHFAQYSKEAPPVLPSGGDWNYVLRNHIYRYTITSVNVTLDLEVNVLPWTLVEDDEWDYTENVVIDDNGFLVWDEKTVAAINKTASSVTLKDSGDAFAVGTFKIASPKGGKWYASFVPISGVEDAFMFVDEDGNEINPATGDVGVDGTIRIKARYNRVSDVNNAARLVIMVQTIGGRWMEAKVCEGDNRNYTIIQNITEID